MKKNFLLTGTLVILALMSCKKNDAVKPVDPEPVKLLKKLTKTENNTVTVFNFQYDAARRLLSYKSSDNKTGIDFTYDGNGNLIKAVNNEDDYLNVYTYSNNNGVPVSGTFRSWEKTGGQLGLLIEDDQLTYTVEQNRVTKIHLKFLLAADETDFNLSYGSNGNLSKIVSGNNNYTASFGYGSKKPVFPVVSKYILDQAGFSLQFAAKNELLSIAFDFPGTQFDESVTNQYTYDASGYVLSSNDGSSQANFEYQ
jgi:YD repeat-containing protein